MESLEQFVDYYAVLRVNPNCSARALEAAYHSLAKIHHPDHSDSADVAKLTAVIEAYKALREAGQRAEYDRLYTEATGFVFSNPEDDQGGDKAAVSDADAHNEVLMLLYKKKRSDALSGGVGRYFVQEMLGCTDNVFEFHLWYLKEKGFIVTAEDGTLDITIAGVDQVISLSRSVSREKLLISQFVRPDEEASF